MRTFQCFTSVEHVCFLDGYFMQAGALHEKQNMVVKPLSIYYVGREPLLILCYNVYIP